MMVKISLPKNRLKQMLRCGFFISPAMNVTLFQASLLKMEPTIETAIAPNKKLKLSGCHETGSPVVECVCMAWKPVCQFRFQKSCFTSRKPKMIKPKRDMIFAEVNVV